MSYWEQVSKNFFDANDKIRYVGIVDRSFHLLHSANRPGLSSLAPAEIERTFVSIVPPILVEGAEKVEPQCGPVEGLLIQYKKVIFTIHRVGEYIVMLSFEPSIEMPFINRTSQLVKSIMK